MPKAGYRGTKFGRERDQRRALIKSLAEALIINESVETTLPKAKELARYMEKLITKAKKGTLHSRRQVIAKLQTIDSSNRLINELTPKMSARSSGHLRVVKTNFRVGDNAQMAKISFVDDLSVKLPAKPNQQAQGKQPATNKKAKKPAKKVSKATKKAQPAAKTVSRSKK